MTIHTVRDGNRVIHTIQDGRDYRELLDLVRSGKIETTRPGAGSCIGHRTAIVEYGGRKYLVKKGMRLYSHFDSRLKYRLFGSPFFAGMKKMEQAIAGGCDRIQRVFLVEETAERDGKTGTLHVVAWLVLEFLPGEMVRGHRDEEDLVRMLPEAIREIHKHKLTQPDCNLSNFIISDGKLKIIDLYFTSSPFFWSAFRTVDRIKKTYGLDVPVDGALNKVAFALAKTVYCAADGVWVFLRKKRRK